MAESIKAPRVAELMCRFNADVKYKLMDEGKAHLAHTLAIMYNAQPMVAQHRNQQNILVQRVIKHRFDAHPKLNTKIQEHYEKLFGRPQSANDCEEEETTKTTKTPLAFGHGAMLSNT